jgi:hypothetical protein
MCCELEDKSIRANNQPSSNIDQKGKLQPIIQLLVCDKTALMQSVLDSQGPIKASHDQFLYILATPAQLEMKNQLQTL